MKKYLTFLIPAQILLLTYLFSEAMLQMVNSWEREEYSHGYLIPVISLYFIWQKKNDILQNGFQGSWLGIVILVIGLVTGFLGIASSLYTIQQYGFLISLYGLILSFSGRKTFMIMLVPLLMLVFMIPLPNFLYFNLSQKLQLISSSIGVYVIRLFDISVYLEGNVIDLGIYKLQVVDACSGLRYLFPLMSFGFICAYLFNAPFWQRAFIFLTTLPITVLMNSFRIGMIGVLVNYFGIEQAEGFLHDFEGWIIFMACVGILFLEMTLLTLIFNRGKRLSEVFGLEVPKSTIRLEQSEFKLSQPLLAVVPVLLISLFLFNSYNNIDEVIPEREQFITFPDQFDNWNGRRSNMEPQYVSALKGMTDYIISDYSRSSGETVNFYVAYYENQKAGSSIHSPKSCLPGGGWKIHSHTKPMITLEEESGSESFEINRVLIQLGDNKQLVYYWFPQRGRNISNEYLAKFYIFYDSLMSQRTDGALVRLITPVKPGEDIESADERLMDLLDEVYPEFDQYIPD